MIDQGRVFCEACGVSVLGQNYDNHLLGATHERNARRRLPVADTDPTPRTEAGRRLLAAFQKGAQPSYLDAILAIEAEARGEGTDPTPPITERDGLLETDRG